MDRHRRSGHSGHLLCVRGCCRADPDHGGLGRCLAFQHGDAYPISSAPAPYAHANASTRHADLDPDTDASTWASDANPNFPTRTGNADANAGDRPAELCPRSERRVLGQVFIFTA